MGFKTKCIPLQDGIAFLAYGGDRGARGLYNCADGRWKTRRLAKNAPKDEEADSGQNTVQTAGGLPPQKLFFAISFFIHPSLRVHTIFGAQLIEEIRKNHKKTQKRKEKQRGEKAPC